MNFWDSSASVITYLSDQIGSGISTLAGLVGDVATHLYAVLVRQQIVVGIQNAVTSIAFFCLSILTYRFIKKVRSSGTIEQLDKYFLYAAILAITFWAATKGINYMNVAIPYLLNPEYKAIIEATNLLKSIQK